MDKHKSTPFAIAAILALVATIYTIVTPTTVSEVYSEVTNGELHPVEYVGQRQISWYEAQGAHGIAVLLLFLLLFAGTWAFAARSRYVLLAIFSLLAVILTLLASFSVGPLYYPAALAVIIGWVLLALRKWRSAKKFTD